MSDMQEPDIKKPKGKNKRIKTETLLRETATNYIRLIGDSDRKARIMLIVNSIFLTISVTLLTKKISVPYSWISGTILLLSNVLSLFFSIQSIKPEFKNHENEDSMNNILHYKKCDELSLTEYRDAVIDTMKDDIKKMDAFIKELYFYGRLLVTKYKYVKIAYHLFSWGTFVAVISYLFIVFIINK